MTSKIKSKSSVTMEQLLARAKNKFVSFSVGQKVKAKVLSKDSKSINLDIGGKSEGVVAEKAFAEARDFIKTLKVGDEVTASVLIPETRDGTIILSLRSAMQDAAWEMLEKAQKDNEEVAVYGKGVNASGVTVEIEGLIGFIPMSQLGHETVKNPQKLVEKYFKVKPIEVDRNTNKIVLSEREVSEAKGIADAKKMMKKVKTGDVLEGKVTTVASFGCFVEVLPNLEGLVHVSEISWGRVGVPSEVVKKGDKVKVMVIGARDGKLALSIRQALKDPWDGVEKKYKSGAKVEGKITKISDYGIFVELEPGIEGLVHITKIPPTSKFTQGTQVNCFIEEVGKKDKKISLGLILTEKPLGYK
ncbi:30S ribosomal protein S1 [Patescibacteria group bacterium]